MAEAGHAWQETKKTKTSVVEHFLQGKHLQSCGWDGPVGYEYIPDSEVLGSKVERNLPRSGCQFRVKSLIHATTPKAAANIIKDGGVRPNFKRLMGDAGLGLIWWGMALEETDIKQYTEQCRISTSEVKRDRGAKEQQAEVDGLSNQFEALTTDGWLDNFCNSAPFAKTSRYGNIVFEYTIDELLSAYSSQFCNGEQPVFRVMGTFAYRQEVKHAVLVCPPNKYRKKFPLVNEGVSVIFKKDGVWVWNPETTGDKMFGPRLAGSYRRWEHATFAFRIQEDQSPIFTLNNSDMHISYCVSAEVFRRHTFKDTKPWTFDETLRFLHERSTLQPIQLLTMIHKHIVQVLRLKVNVQSEGVITVCKACSEDVKLRTSFLQTLLNGKPGQDQVQTSYCPHEPHQKVENLATCTQRWQLWIREMTHYLLTE